MALFLRTKRCAPAAMGPRPEGQGVGAEPANWTTTSNPCQMLCASRHALTLEPHRMQRPMPRAELVAKLRKMLTAQAPGPPTARCTLLTNNPQYYDPTLDDDGARALLEEATPEGWLWRGAERTRTPKGGWRYNVHLERRPIAAPFTPGQVLEEYEQLDGDWQAVSIVLDVTYREFSRWMNTEEFADLAGLWGEERVRLEALRQYGAERSILRGPYTRRAQDDAELVAIGREHLFAAPLAQQMRDQVTDGRTWPPVAVLRRYCETGHQGLLEHLRKLDWVD